MPTTITRDASGAVVAAASYSVLPEILALGEEACDAATFAAARVGLLPVEVPTITPAQFLALFTPGEEAAVFAAAQGAVLGWIVKLLANPAIQLTDPQVVAGVEALAAVDLIATPRIAQVLVGVAFDAVAFDTPNTLQL